MRSIVMTIVVMAMTAEAGATVVVPTDLGELSRDARAIARGRVVAVLGQWTDDRRAIETVVTLEAETFLKGQLGDTVQFRVPGGTIGRFRNIVVGAPRFTVGQRVIVFLGTQGPSVPFVIGLSEGVFRVAQDERGGWLVTPPAVMPGVALVVRGSSGRVALPLADFEQRVRALARGGAQ